MHPEWPQPSPSSLPERKPPVKEYRPHTGYGATFVDSDSLPRRRGKQPFTRKPHQCVINGRVFTLGPKPSTSRGKRRHANRSSTAAHHASSCWWRQ